MVFCGVFWGGVGWLLFVCFIIIYFVVYQGFGVFYLFIYFVSVSDSRKSTGKLFEGIINMMSDVAGGGWKECTNHISGDCPII